ncbi:insulinase family protein, partial [bacterium]|nr:insulinase family protein [bacterium]
MEDHELPLIRVEARIRTGENYEPADKVGLGSIFGQVQREGGTTTMPANEMDDFLEARAASIETSMSGEVGFAAMDTLAGDFDDVVTLFADVLRKPAFEEDRIEQAKTGWNTAISRRNDQMGGIAGREFQRLIYGRDTSLGRMAEYATVAAVTRDDLVAWHKRFYHPNNVWLGVVGDFDSKEMLEKIKSVFGDWERGPDFDEPAPTYEMVGSGMYFVEKGDVTQASVTMGHLGIRQSDPDFFAVQVMNEVLGGGFAARLFSNVRSKKGLAYNVSGGVGSSFTREGVFQVGLSTKSETTAAAIDALYEEIEGIISNPPSKEEMKRAKEAILNSFVFNYTSRRQILSQQMLYDYYGLPSDWLDSYRDNIEAVTEKQVAEAAEKHVHPDKMAVLVVGKSAEFDRPLDSFGEVTTIDITIPAPVDTREKIERSAGALAAGSELIAKAAKAMEGTGGKIDATDADFSMMLSIGGQEMQFSQKIAYELPDKIRTTIKTPMGDQIMVAKGDEGYASAGGQVREMPAASLRENLDRNLLVLAYYADNSELEAVAGGSEDVDGTSCTNVEVTYSGLDSRLCIAEDGKVLKQAYQGTHPLQGTPGLIEIYFSKYTEQDGRVIPFAQEMHFEGEKLVVLNLQSIDLNPDLDPALFEKPE